jgi:hypothetical protein
MNNNFDLDKEKSEYIFWSATPKPDQISFFWLDLSSTHALNIWKAIQESEIYDQNDWYMFYNTIISCVSYLLNEDNNWKRSDIEHVINTTTNLSADSNSSHNSVTFSSIFVK